MHNKVMYIQRNIESVLQQAIKQFPAVLISGSRQTGKSTLLQHLFPHYNYITLDDPIIRNLAINDPELFLKTYTAPLIIDEIQYAPKLLHLIKIAIDTKRDEYGRYLLTGSQLFSLMQGVSESLAGRVMVFHLCPLTWSELHTLDPCDNQMLANQIIKGFYPELNVHSNINAKFWHASYLSTYLERDLRSMRNIHDLGLFQKFLVLLAARAGQLLNLNEIAKECMISQTTAKEWITLLQASSIIYLLEPYAKNVTKRVVKSSKLFFIDTGLLCYLLRLTDIEQILFSPFGGHIFENMVIIEVIKNFLNAGNRPPCYFYRTSNGVEVDLLIDRGTVFEAFEIKFSASPNKDMAKSLKAFAETFPTNKQCILCLKKEKIPFSDTIHACHWWDGVRLINTA